MGDELKEYLAGYFDGDGSVMLRAITKKPGSYLLTAFVGSCAEAQCRLFEAVFGGSVRRIVSKHVEAYYEWRATQAKGEAVLRALLPYLHVRREHAEIALLYRAGVGLRGRSVSLAQQEERAGFAARVRALNARGVLAPLRHSAGDPAALTLSYLAGLFDAEGTVSWVADKQRMSPLLHVGVVNTDAFACHAFAAHFGGSVNHVRRAGRGIFSWYLRQRKALPVLAALVPYLREKRAAAEAALTKGIQPARRVALHAVEGGKS